MTITSSQYHSSKNKYQILSLEHSVDMNMNTQIFVSKSNMNCNRNGVYEATIDSPPAEEESLSSQSEHYL